MSYETRLKEVVKAVNDHLTLNAEIHVKELAREMLHTIDAIPEKMR